MKCPYCSQLVFIQRFHPQTGEPLEVPIQIGEHLSDCAALAKASGEVPIATAGERLTDAAVPLRPNAPTGLTGRVEYQTAGGAPIGQPRHRLETAPVGPPPPTLLRDTVAVPLTAAALGAVPLAEFIPEPVVSPLHRFWSKVGGGSLTISLLFHAAILAIGVILVVAIIPPPPEKKVDFSPSGGGGGTPASQQTNQSQQRQVMRNSASRISAIGGISDLALPEPDLSNVGMTSLGDLGSLSGGLGGSGSGGGRGSGTGLGLGAGLGSGMGSGSSLFTFFGQQATSGAERIAFVIDFSGSNTNAQRDAIRREVARVLDSLPPTTRYQIIGFAGCVWTLGDTFEQVGEPGADDEDLRSHIVVGGNGREYRYEWDYKSGYAWRQSNALIPPMEWLQATPENTALSKENMQKQQFIGGTNWDIALAAALKLDPLPEEIYFLTDGAHVNSNERTAEEVAEDRGRQIRNAHITLHCIALVTDAAVDGLRPMAEGAHGDLIKAATDGSAEQVGNFETEQDREERARRRSRRRLLP